MIKFFIFVCYKIYKSSTAFSTMSVKLKMSIIIENCHILQYIGYKNVIWISGHSCYRWEDGEQSFINQFSGDQYLNFCNKDFDIYKPTGNEYYQNPADSNSISKDYNQKIYSRYPLNIENQTLEVALDLFGQETSVEVEMSQIQKI